MDWTEGVDPTRFRIQMKIGWAELDLPPEARPASPHPHEAPTAKQSAPMPEPLPTTPRQ